MSIWLPTAAVSFVYAPNVFSAKIHECPAAVHVVSSRSPLPHTTPRRSLVPLPPARACHTSPPYTSLRFKLKPRFLFRGSSACMASNIC